MCATMAGDQESSEDDIGNEFEHEQEVNSEDDDDNEKVSAAAAPKRKAANAKAKGKDKSSGKKPKHAGVNEHDVDAKVKKGPGKPGGGRPSKVKDGQKYCEGCSKPHPIEEFPLRSSRCYPTKQAYENLKNAAGDQGQEEW